MNNIPFDRLVQDLKNLGLKRGDLINAKVSLKSIGTVEGGAETVLNAILEVLGPEGTVVTDSFVKASRLPILSPKKKKPVDDYTPSYAGALANAMLAHPKVIRSKHPIQKFAAIGKLAENLMLNHTPNSYAYDVLKRMSYMGGKNLKIGPDHKVVGVGTTHVAIGILGFYQRRPAAGVYYKDENGSIRLFKRNWSGICDKGLINFIPLYRERGAILSEAYVGKAESKITDMQKTLEIEIEQLRKDPTFFFCNDPTCDGCRLTWTCSEKQYGTFLLQCLKQKKFKKIVRVFAMEPFFYVTNKVIK